MRKEVSRRTLLAAAGVAAAGLVAYDAFSLRRSTEYLKAVSDGEQAMSLLSHTMDTRVLSDFSVVFPQGKKLREIPLPRALLSASVVQDTFRRYQRTEESEGMVYNLPVLTRSGEFTTLMKTYPLGAANLSIRIIENPSEGQAREVVGFYPTDNLQLTPLEVTRLARKLFVIPQNLEFPDTFEHEAYGTEWTSQGRKSRLVMSQSGLIVRSNV